MSHVDGAVSEDKKSHSVVHVVADSGGFVGAFLSKEEVAHAVLRAYPGMGFVMYSFPLNATLPSADVYIIPYQGSNAIAFVSNDVEKCKEVHRALVAVSLSYDDEVDFWRHPVGVLCAPAKKRLDHIKKGVDTFGDLSAEEKLFAPIPDGPLERLLKETERITIFDSVVPIMIPGSDLQLEAQGPPDSAPENPAPESSAPESQDQEVHT